MTVNGAQPAQSAQPASRHGSVALAVIVVCQLMVVLDATIVNIALPKIQHALSFSPTSLSWVINAYSLAFGGMLLLGARAGDLFGRRRVFLAGIALFTAASFAGGFTNSAGLLLTARVVQGVGAAFASPSALALLMITFTEARERTRALGLYTGVSIGGAAVGLIAGGILTEWASWRWVFFVNVPIGIGLLVAARTALTETDRVRGRVDIPGALASVLGMTALVYGIVRAATNGWGASATLGYLGAGVAMLAVFAVIESRTATPITPLRLFTDRTRNLSYISRLTLVAAVFGMFFFLSQFLQDILRYSAIQTGLAFLPLTVCLFAASQFSARRLVGRVDSRILIAGGVAASAVGMIWLTGLTEHSTYLGVLGPLILVGLGNGSAFVPLTSASLTGVAPGDSGAASGLVNVMQQVGGALGLAVLVSVFGSASRSAAAHPVAGVSPAVHNFVAGAHRAFEVSAGLLVLTVVLSLLMRPAARAQKPENIDDELLLLAEEAQNL